MFVIVFSSSSMWIIPLNIICDPGLVDTSCLSLSFLERSSCIHWDWKKAFLGKFPWLAIILSYSLNYMPPCFPVF
jgi:hypothetical protein